MLGGGTRLIERNIESWAVHEACHQMFDEGLALMLTQVSEPLLFFLHGYVLRENLRTHMEFEENLVLPLYEETVSDPPPAGSVAEFFDDHEMIRRHGAHLLDIALQTEFKEIEPSLLRQTLGAFDDLLEHHHERERKYLYSALGRHLDAGRRAAVEDALSEVERFPLEEYRGQLEALVQSDDFRNLTIPYRDWCMMLRRGQLHDLDESFEAACQLSPLWSEKERSVLQKLLSRDARLVETFCAIQDEDPREVAREERKVDQTLRSTIQYGVRAFFREMVTVEDD